MKGRVGEVAASDLGLARRTFNRILLIKPSSLGDLIHALPVLHGLRRRYPEASISWLVAEQFAPLIAGHPELDDVILFDRRRYGMMGRGMGSTAAFVDFIKSLRARRFDLAIDLQGLFRSGFLSMATGAPVRIGFAAAREMAWLFYTHHIRVAEPDRHAADRNYLVGRLLGFESVPMVFDLAVTADERRAAIEIIEDAGLQPGDPFLAVLPGARWETKRWAAARFAAMIDRVAADYGVPTLLLGGPGEEPVCEQVVLGARSKPANLAGETSVRDLVAILERASVVVAHDSAPMHMSAALGRPLVAILGPTNRHRTGPYGMTDSVVQADVPCAPCYLKRLSQCAYDHRCMGSVGVDDVVGRIGTYLAGVRDEDEPARGSRVSVDTRK